MRSTSEKSSLHVAIETGERVKEEERVSSIFIS